MDSDQGKLFVGGISWETTDAHLTDYFQRYGEIAEAVIMKDRTTGRARGFGFVTFSDPAAADMALLEKHTINGRLVEAKKAVPRDEQQAMPRSSISSGGQSPGGGQGRTKKIFVGGLASTVTEEEFRAYFEQFGTITDAVVMYDHTTQRPRGFGFITYDTEEAVDAVLLKSFHELKEKMVEVKRAVPRDQTPPAMKSPVSTYPASAGRAYGQYPSPGMYAGRPDGRFGGMPARGAYPYPAGGYPGYAGGAYLMNGSYPGGYPAGYAGGAGYGAAGGYGGGAGGYGSGATSPGYGNTPNRNAWPGAGAYGGQGYAGGGYGTGMWGSPSQNPGQAGGYGGYYGSDNGYGSSGGAAGAGGYGARGSGYGSSPGGYGSTGAGAGSGSYNSAAGNGGSYNSGGYNEGYGNSGYPDGSWGSGEGYNNNGSGAGAGNGSYDVVGSGTNESGGAGSYGGGYGSATNRQSQRGNASETRFRPYPPANDRS